MKRKFAIAVLLCLSAALLPAQDLVIANARLIVGNGTVINPRCGLVRGGKIAFIGQGASLPPPGVMAIDAKGMSVMPGFIDAHRHINTGPDEKVQMQQLLEAGYTTVLSGGGPAEGNITLRDHIEKGVINGPRIIPSGSLRLNNNTPEKAREEVRKMAAMGIKFTGEIALTPKPGPSPRKWKSSAPSSTKRRRSEYWCKSTPSAPPPMMAAVDAGVPLLVHTPHFGWLTMDEAKRVSAAGIKQFSTIGFGVPVFGVFADDNKPRFRDGKPWPESILDGDGRGQEAGYKAVNARTSWDAGVIYGYGTDTNYEPHAGLEHELKSLNLMFSMQDIIKLMGPNTASYIQMSDQLGTLEPGKLADMVVLDGNPLEGYWNFLNAKVVVKGGVVVVDKR